MAADTHVGAGSVLAGAVGLAQAPVGRTLVHVWEGKMERWEKKEEKKLRLHRVSVQNPNTI